MKEIYLDHAATTPLDARVKEAMESYWNEQYGNPSSLHRLGREAKEAMEQSRAVISAVFGCVPSEIIYTGSGTEAINLGLLGAARASRHAGTHIITTRIEHHAVLRSVEVLQREGFSVTYAGVDAQGLIDPEELRKLIRPDTILLSVMYANNEIGTIQPIAEIGKVIKDIRQERKENRNATPIMFFTDACQAAGALDLNTEKLGVDLMALNGSKIYGPKGVGCLYKRKEVKLEPSIFGGGQERGLRSGTENVACIVGLAAALRHAEDLREEESKRLTALRDYFLAEVLKAVPGSVLNGHAIMRLPNNINISIAGLEGETAVLYLDKEDIYCSTGAACSAASLEPSHVILELGRSPDEAQGSLRFTLGRTTVKEDVDYAVAKLAEVVRTLRPQS